MLLNAGQVYKGFKKTVFIFSILFFFFVDAANAQNPKDPSSPDVPELPKTQLPPADLYNMLKDKNGETKKTGEDANKKLKDRIEKDSLVKEKTPQSLNPTEDTYGMNLFRTGIVASLSELSTPPLDYPIGVYDQIIVSLWNGAEATLDYTVARDGSIFPTSIGKIYLQGLTFENVRSLLTRRFKAYVPPSTNISVSIGQPRTISVNVAGEVKNQGPVTVSAFTNAFNVIALAGGPTNLANLREIQIKRNGKIIDVLDVYKYLTTGDFGKHIYLDNNDFVILQTVEKKVKAEGKFKRPMFYQLKKDEGMKALLKYSGGLEREAFSSGVKIYRTELEKQVIQDVNATAIINPTNDIRLKGEDYPLIDGDIVKVIAVNPGLFNKIEMKGEISYPGQYEARKGDKLFDLINRAGGITRNTYLPRAFIFRGGGDSTNIKASRVEVNLTAITTNDTSSIYNVELFANDQVLLFNTNQFADKQYVEIFGEIRKEGKVNRYGGMTLQDLLYLSGGLKQSAEYGRIEISSVVDLDSAKGMQQPTRTILRTLKLSPNIDLDSVSAGIELRPYDQVYVRKNPTFELQQLILINGMVKYSGPYPRLSKSERISSYIERAGGVKEEADLTGAILYRKKTQYFRENVTSKVASLTDSVGSIVLDSVKTTIAEVANEPVSIDLYRALKYKNSKYDIVLQEGDVIFIPEINPFVNVKGIVQSPLKLTFDKEHTSVGYYIDKAGGFGIRPWRKRIFVTYANGKSRRTKNLFFMHFYPKVKEGSTVTVPSRPEGAEITDTLLQVVVSAIPVALAAYLVNLLR
ncbi:MAG: SLBB domain-containing protein [Chitinophagaceae bacterium]|nr:SLBB domain-containing protein [Chitinophagaceae bacterium]MBK9483693.1 SLBB domain-containing protein [Chitinophagaceae bacterium]MBL0200778.1 SLBB domain-containing protein [Chitinophagaceae bacterium]